jgi:ABC-type transport system involved in multi-copper enzyme maturation permease subunit
MTFRLSEFGLPMLAKDLVEMAQRRRTYAVRVAFALLVFSMSAVLMLPVYGWAKGSPIGMLGRGSMLLYALYVIEWLGLCLFVPAVVSGALADEKERNTLQLLFLTRLGPWTILLEKLLSRLVSVITFLLVSLPVLCLAYLMGGVARSDVEFAALGLAVTAFQMGGIALFSSAYCATSSSAVLLSYLLVVFVFLFPPLTYFAVLLIDPALVSPVLGHGWHVWLNATQGINHWFYFSAAALPPFHRSWVPLLVISSTGVIFLLLARLVVVRRAAPQAKHRVRRFFQWLDRGIGWINDRLAFGLVLGRVGNDLPNNNPVAWREGRRGNLGQINYLTRVLLVLELPILGFTVLYVSTTRDLDYSRLSDVGLLFWTIAIVVLLVRSAGLIAAEKSHQTLDVLLATPLSLSALAGAKMRGLWRLALVVAVPILLNAFLVSYFFASYSQRPWSYFRLQGFTAGQSAQLYLVMEVVNLVLVLGLTAQLAFCCGLLLKTQGRAVATALGVFIAWSFFPLIVQRITWGRGWVFYFSPISGLLANEFAEVGNGPLGIGREAESKFSGFYLLIYCGIYAVIAATLAWINHGLAGRVLLRPTVPRTRSRPSSASSDPLGYARRFDSPG